jgi:hypothetical protein
LVAVASYAGVLAVLTIQALLGQSIVQPTGGILIAEVALLLATAVAAGAVLRTGHSDPSTTR